MKCEKGEESRFNICTLPLLSSSVSAFYRFEAGFEFRLLLSFRLSICAFVSLNNTAT
jgi:hypothetical protein